MKLLAMLTVIFGGFSVACFRGIRTHDGRLKPHGFFFTAFFAAGSAASFALMLIGFGIL